MLSKSNMHMWIKKNKKKKKKKKEKGKRREHYRAWGA
jgi:DNA-binding transcriptional regulator GbsR (MarR family)